MIQYKKISQLANAAAVTAGNVVEMVQAGTSVQASALQLRDYIVEDPSALTAIVAGTASAMAATSAMTAAFAPRSSYSTGWVANSDWTNADLTVTHNLDVPLSELIVKMFISSDGTEANAFGIDVVTRVVDTGSGLSLNIGTTIFAVSDDAFKIQTGADGLAYIRDSDGLTPQIEAQSWYYKVVVYSLGVT